MAKKQYKIGLALGGGGVKGLAHIGVLKVLERNGIKPDMVAGTSMGSIIGAWYASGKSPEEMERAILGKSNWKEGLRFLDPAWKHGLLKGEKIMGFISDMLGRASFDDMAIPLAIVATDLKTGQQAVFRKGDMIQSIRASISVPPIFTPIKIGSRIYADGGLVNPVPDDVVRGMGAGRVISVNVEAGYLDDHWSEKTMNTTNISARSLNILRYYLAQYSLNSTDVKIEPIIKEPSIIGYERFFRPEKVKEIIRIGEKAAEKKLFELKEIFSSPALRGSGR